MYIIIINNYIYIYIYNIFYVRYIMYIVYNITYFMLDDITRTIFVYYIMHYI